MNLIRQMDIFDVYEHQNKAIHIIGAGASGSYLAFQLAKQGLQNITVWDADIVEEHNIPNQIYFEKHIGMKKVDALKEIIYNATGTNIKVKRKFVTKDTKINSIVFVLVDSMEVRKEIWDNCLKLKPSIDRMIETRMGSDTVYVYFVDPKNLTHIDKWEKGWYPDSEAEVSACGSSITIACTASLTASIAVWQLVKYLNRREVEYEVIIGSTPQWALLTRFM